MEGSNASSMVVESGILYFIDRQDNGRWKAGVPEQQREHIMRQYHGGLFAGHVSGRRLAKMLSRRWWWPRMQRDCIRHTQNCPECVVAGGKNPKCLRPPLRSIPVERPFQIVGVDIMQLPRISSGYQYVVVFQDFLTKWPLVFPLKDQKATRLVHLLVEELVPVFGMPEALLSDRGTNLLSHLMSEVCQALGIHRLMTTPYHPQCNGKVERFNRTLKTGSSIWTTMGSLFEWGSLGLS